MADSTGTNEQRIGYMNLSVVIPAHNAAHQLRACLEALQRSDLPAHECIVVDDGSTDDTAAVAASFPVRLLQLDTRCGPARARNLGAAAATAEFVVFLDADVCVHADTLRRLRDHLRDHGDVAAVFGSYDDAPRDPHTVSQFKNLMHHYVHQHSRTRASTFWAGCGAIRRDVFRQVGGFDESYTRPCIEDIELGVRLCARGGCIALDGSIQVQHLKAWRFGSLLRSDLRDRAVPWLQLMFRSRSMPRDLNVRHRDRVGVALVWASIGMVLLAAAGAITPARAAVLGITCLTAVGALYAHFYRFLAQKRGLSFMLGAVPLHWVYLWYCGLAFPIAVLAFAWGGRGRRSSAQQPLPSCSPGLAAGRSQPRDA